MRLWLFALLLVTKLAWSQVAIEVFEDEKDQVVIDNPATVYHLDEAKAFKAASRQALKGLTALEAKSKAKELIDSQRDAFKANYQGLALANSYQLTHLPAVVFNHGEAVIYGATSVSWAFKEYEQWSAK